MKSRAVKILKTPLLPFYSTEELTANIYLKPENLQPFGSYKVRGIESVFHNTSTDKLTLGVAAASAGNMGQAIAFMARNRNIPCTIYVPDSAPSIKKDRIRNLNAEVIELPFQELWRFITHPPLSPEGPLFIHPIFTELLLLGYENIAREIIEDLPEMDAIVIPFGIGGLSIAVSRVVKLLRPDVDVFVCEPETAAPFKAAMLQGKSTPIQMKKSFVDAIGTPQILPQVFDSLAPVITDSEVVSLQDIQKALQILLLNNKLLCEGAAACSVAAAINLSKKNAYKNIVCIVTGGNLAVECIRTFF